MIIINFKEKFFYINKNKAHELLTLCPNGEVSFNINKQTFQLKNMGVNVVPILEYCYETDKK